MLLEQLIEKYVDFRMSVRDIAKEYGVSHVTMSRKMKEMGIDVYPKRRKNPIIVECLFCHKPIERCKSTVSKRNFCNYFCHASWMVGNTRGENCANWKGGITAISSDNLKTPEFRDLKKIVLSRFPLCVICGNEKTLHVHHIKTRRLNPELAFDINNLITLCRSCHSTIKGKEKIWENHFISIVCKSEELRETLNASAHDNPQASLSNVISLVDRKLQRLTVEDSQTNKTDTRIALERDEIVRTSAKVEEAVV